MMLINKDRKFLDKIVQLLAAKKGKKK